MTTVGKSPMIAGKIFHWVTFHPVFVTDMTPLDLGRRSGIFNSSLRVIKLEPRGGRSTVTLQANCGFLAVKIKISSLTSYKGRRGV